MLTKTLLALTMTLAVFVSSHAIANQKGSDKGPMNPSDGFWQMLDALEREVPLGEAKLQSHLRFFFAFMSGGLRRVSFDFGGHGSPGI